MIELREVTFRYGASTEPSVRSFDLSVAPGEFVVLCGRSGCGKTTVTRLVNGLAPRFFEGELEGSVRLDGCALDELSMDEIVMRVGSVFQDPRSQFFTTDATSEIAFTCENLGMGRGELLERVARSSRELGADELLERSIFELSSGEKQRIAMASAHAHEPRVYVLDEPSANLDPDATAQLASVLGVLKQRGATIVVSEHRLGYLLDMLDRAVVIEQGENASELSAGELASLGEKDRARWGLRDPHADSRAVAEVGSGPRGECRMRGSEEAVRRNAALETGVARSPFLLEIDGLAFSYRRGAPVFDGVSFTAQAGDVIALVGRNGAGKSTLASVLCGLKKQAGGSIRLEGAELNAKRRRAASCFIMQDADYQLFAESVADELELGAGDAPDIGARVDKALAQLGLTEVGARHPASLSGGQKQRVTIGCALTRDSDLVFFDEPTSGLDGENMRRVGSLIRDLANAGKIVFVITHDFELVEECCTRTLRLADGCIVEDRPTELGRGLSVAGCGLHIGGAAEE